MTSLEEFFDEPESIVPGLWGTDKEIERRDRIKLSMAAYVYEFHAQSIMSDGDFDSLALKIRPELSTIEEYHTDEQVKRYSRLDTFFREEFSPYTGQWIHKHPEIDRLHLLFEKRGCHFSGKDI